ncbi:glycosyltransferase family 8 protein, partial [Campylobacter jejuni]|nr:glycosyltransferase family 8 protein [Campylobacter jejuni]EAI0169620.1 glycosyltransferase family 8 protein [Campylobacter jejuni]EAL5653591.1 glycosyltransferase family 8 protein [Campylobacter jejuni]ECR2238690.1 glycosyltransferase family 8 protein [Campylobacter jejuni]EDP4695790.1 glycosyltransferase family 8 protein [Campylobacter jejuni]
EICNFEKLKKMENILNLQYPTKICIHEVDEKQFQKLPPWFGSRATYFILLFENFLPIETSKCLIMDIDMLVLQDLRELFSCELKECLLGAVYDYSYYKEPSILLPRKSVEECNKKDFYFKYPEKYFNGGLLLINVKKWKLYDVTNKMYNFFSKYNARVAMQDAMNAVVDGNILKLPISWNFFPNNLFIEKTFNNDPIPFNFNYTDKEYYSSEKDIKIIHFAYDSIKPWGGSDSKRMDSFGKIINYPYYKEWWDVALRTPVFSDELKELRQNLFYQSLLDYSENMSCIIERMLSSIDKTKIKIDYVEQVKNHLSFQLGQHILRKKNFLAKIILPFTLFLIYIKYKLKKNKQRNSYIPQDSLDYIDVLKIKNSKEYQLGGIIIGKMSLYLKIKKIIRMLKEYEKR